MCGDLELEDDVGEIIGNDDGDNANEDDDDDNDDDDT